MILAFLLVLYIGPVNLCPSSVAPDRVNGPNSTKDFSLSVDGAESDKSITSFSETLPSDDVLFYPDVFHDTTVETADSGNNSASDPVGSLSETYTKDGTTWGGTEGVGDGIYIQLWFDVSVNIEGFTYAVFWNGSGDINLDVWDHTAESWETLEDSPTGENSAMGWDNGTVYSNDYFNTTHVGLRFEVDGIFPPIFVYVDYAEITLYEMTLKDADHYAESFVSVDDWTTSDTSISTDGDVATITENGAGDSGGAYYEFASTRNLVDYYYEVSATVEAGAGWKLRFYDHSASWWYDVFYAPTSGTMKGIFTSTANDIDRIGVFVYGEGKYVKPDYLRIFPANESGWQHSGSTTEGVTNDGDGDKTYSVSSDGDILTLNITTDPGASGNSYYYIGFDTTATKTDIERDHYPFIEVRARLIENTGLVAGLYFGSDGYKTTIDSEFTSTDWTTYRFNHYAATIESSIEAFYLQWGSGSAKTIEVEVDFVKCYSIANWTYSGSSVPTDDYLYTDSGVLYSSIDDGYIELNHDPALSVTDTYAVWNLTTGSTAPQFSDYVSSWASYSSATRGALQSGTVTDLKLKFTADGDLSEIKFISDGTAPTVVRSSSTPNDPQDDENVTISTVIEDTVEVYSVVFNAIVYPAGFSDVDYSATEQTDNLWTYTFTTIDAGYYCFKVIASDGANTNSLTEYAYIELTVREAAIIIQEITLIGAGQDFTMMTFSARINRDCSYTIYEESASSPEADTYTGSVSAPSFNLAWEKLDVVDTNVNFTITFVSGSLTENYTSQYQVAQTTFYVEWGSDNGEQFSEDVKVTGRITKLATYTVFIDDINATSGTLTSLDFEIEFDKKELNSAREAWHDFAIKFVNSSQVCWYNSTFYLWKHDPDKPPGGGVVVFDPDFWLKIMIAMSVIFGAGLIILKSTGYGNLPDYKGGK